MTEERDIEVTVKLPWWMRFIGGWGITVTCRDQPLTPLKISRKDFSTYEINYNEGPLVLGPGESVLLTNTITKDVL